MRKSSFKALVGSHNYGLNTADSDRDYKEFFYPSFEDLYSGEKYSKAVTGDTEDIEYHDIRKLPDMLWKSNVNFVEVLFSTDVLTNDELFKELSEKREHIASMNLPYLYDACMGMYHKKRKEYERDLTKGEWKKVYKHVMSAVRIVDFLQRYESSNWNFSKAITYQNSEHMRETLFKIKAGQFESETELSVFLEGSEKLLTVIKPVYKGKKEDLGTKEWLYNTVKWKVEEQIYLEIK
ncbi:DNA polymerase beta superfamily protein [Bacillus infantis]|uniref:DNA polymerase beta superfamily protein n=1 Tax=Bacillus infantis TaxID=324767 RepID=UPI003CE8679E